MRLPGRHPLLYNLHKARVELVREDPFHPGQPLFPVAVFHSPGHVPTRVCAYEEAQGASPLPLFSYGACGWQGKSAVSAAVQVEWEPRQDLRQMPREKVVSGVKRARKELPDNRLARHLEKCALTYGCPAAKNFFIGRYEAPLPTAPACNARCLGCLSLQKDSEIPNSQDRIAFTPSPEEIAEVALSHFSRVKTRPVASFGQGCEGDPLLAAGAIVPAIRLIRAKTREGTINLNTNAGRPGLLLQCLEAGLDSIRVSMNSVREETYTAYFRPAFAFADVLESIQMALSRGVWVSVNYLNCPGFTDSEDEREALFAFLARYPVQMIQWRCMNFDPLRYYAAMDVDMDKKPAGMEPLLQEVRKRFPKVRFGYFNPPKESFNGFPGRRYR
jgi:pyruvate-formate lyase-activating enzyme